MAAHSLSSMCDLEAVDSQMHLDQTSQKVRLFWEALAVLLYEYDFPGVTWTL